MNRFKRFFLIILIVQISIISAFSRNDTIQLNRSYGMKIGGFIRSECFFDTRQMSDALDGMLSLYPLPPNFDMYANDINASPNINFTSIASRVNTRFFAPEVFGAKTTAFLEFDFTGTSNTNGVRLRQANIDLKWTKMSLLIGRAWHPFSSNMPTMVSINTGAPFWVFNRSDQIRFNFKPDDKWLFSATASFQADYASLGPVGKSPSYLRNAMLPELTLNIEYNIHNTIIGIAGHTKTIKPRLYTSPDNGVTKYKTDNTLTTFSGQAYINYQSNSWKIKAQSTYHQNMNESLMIGGYTTVSAFNPLTGHEIYTPTQYINYWLNVVYGVKWQTGIFAGYLHSLGTLENVTTYNWYARDPNIKYMYRLSPHLIYNINNWSIGIELEYTVASYGILQSNTRGIISDNTNVGNLRTLLSIYFYF